MSEENNKQTATKEAAAEKKPAAKKPAAKKAALKKIKIIAPVRGTYLLAYTVGQEVEIDKNKAEELIEAKCALPV